MELFVWFWLWDKRLLCGLNYNRGLLKFMWLLPMIVAGAVLPYALLEQYRHFDSPLYCSSMTVVRKNADYLRNLMFLEETIILLCFMASLCMIFKIKLLLKDLAARRSDKNGPERLYVRLETEVA